MVDLMKLNRIILKMLKSDQSLMTNHQGLLACGQPYIYLYTTPIPLHDTYTYTRHLGGQTTSFCENISLMIDRGKGDNYTKIIAIETEAIIS